MIWILSTGIFNGIIQIVTFNSSIYLVYQLLGPMYVLWGFWKVYGHIQTATGFTLTHPISAAIITCTLFLAAVAYNCWIRVQRFRRRLHYIPPLERISSQFATIEEKQTNLLNKIENCIKVRLEEIEEKQGNTLDELDNCIKVQLERLEDHQGNIMNELEKVVRIQLECVEVNIMNEMENRIQIQLKNIEEKQVDILSELQSDIKIRLKRIEERQYTE